MGASRWSRVRRRWQSQLFDTLVRLLADPDTVRARSITDTGLTTKLGEHHPLRILLAEDNTVNQQIALLVLKSMGYRADVIANGFEAVDTIRMLPYDLVLMDVQCAASWRSPKLRNPKR